MPRSGGVLWPGQGLPPSYCRVSRGVGLDDAPWRSRLGWAEPRSADAHAPLISRRSEPSIWSPPAAENALRDAGYQRIGLIPLAALADALTLAELEFAWPADASFQIKRFSGAVAPSGHGLEGLHAEGGRSTGAGQERLDLIIVRIADDRTLAYARRQQEREPTADVS